MIKKASSSEVFDIYARKMISKRADLRTGALRLIQSFTSHSGSLAPEIERSVLSHVSATGGLGARAERGIGALSGASSAEISTKMTGLVHGAHITEGAEQIIAAAQRAGYSGERNALQFLQKYSTDFGKMATEYEALTASGTPTPDKVVQFVRNNEKAIKFYNEVQSNTLKVVTEGEISAAGKIAAESGRSGLTLKEMAAEAASGAGGGAGRASTALSDAAGASAINAGKVMGMVGGGLGIMIQLGVLGGLIYGGYEAYKYVAGKVSETFKTSDEHFQKVKDAMGCIDAIDLEPGAPAVQEREKVKKNLAAFARMESINEAMPNEEAKAIYDAGNAAGKELMGSGNGSLAGFVGMISEKPYDNLDGSILGNKYTSTGSGLIGGGLAGAAAGAAAGSKMTHTLIGAAIGGTLGGLAGFNLLGQWYDEEVNCLLSAGDAIKTIDDELAAAFGVQEKGTAGTDAVGGDRDKPGATRQDSGGSAGSVSFLEKILSVAATQKLGGLPGIDITNERKLTESYIAASRGVENAATILLQKNPNIKSWIDSITKNYPALLSAPIDSKFVKNESVDGLLKSIYSAMQTTAENARKSKITLRDQLAAEGTIIATSGKNNLNKMNKTSKSINNQELIRKAAETRVSYFGDANLGLKEQLTKSYYAGLTDMYNEKPQKRSSDYKDLYPQGETGEDLILQSHPKSVTLADAMGKGGLVENGLEQKEKSTYVALKTPSGNFQSKYASTIGYLQKLAKAADSQGKKEVSKLIKQTIQNLK